MTQHSVEIASPVQFTGVQTPIDDAPSPKTSRIRLLVAIVVFCGVVCVSVGAVFLVQHKNNNHAATLMSALQETPALKLTLHFKRSSMYYYGQDKAQVYVFPRTTGENALEFDGVVNLAHDDVTEKYLFVSNKAYYVKSDGSNTTETSCLRASQVPAFSIVATTLNQASVIDKAQIGDTELNSANDCLGGTLLNLAFGGENFVVCASSVSRQISRAIGQDLDIDVEYLNELTETLPSLEIPSAADGSELNCETIKPQDTTHSRRLQAQSAASEFTNTLLGNREARLFGSSCKCKSEPKPCLFVHGVGNIFAGEMSNTFPFYWGDAHKHVPCCSSTKFVRFDTFKKGWNDPSIQQDLCDAALEVATGSKDNTIGKLILIAHSMGNMITGAALATGKCKMSTDVTWISSAGPMRGSKAANLLSRKCDEGGLNEIIKKPLELIGFCPPTKAFASLFYQDTMDVANQKLLIASQQARQQHVTKTLCGSDGYGINSIFSIPLQIVGLWSNHGDANDGVVSVESCMAGLGNTQFGGSISSDNYLGPLNHEDLAFRNGDGWLGDNRKPVKWLECAL